MCRLRRFGGFGAPESCEDACAEEDVASEDAVEAGVGGYGEDGEFVVFVVEVRLVEVVAAVAEGLVDFDGFFSDYFSIFDDLEVAEPIADGQVVSHCEFVVGMGVAGEA